MSDARLKPQGRHVDPTPMTQSTHCGSRRRATGVVAGVVALGVLGGLLVSHEGALGAASGNLARDTFARTVRSGWGTAANGGAWTTSAAGPTFTVAKHTGRMTLLSSGRPVATLKAVRSARTDLLVSVRSAKVPTGRGTYVDVLGRVTSAGGFYAARLHLLHGGRVTVSLVRRTPAGVASTIAAEATASGVPSRAGATISVRLQVFGVRSTVVRARVWTSGQPEPSSWTVSTKDDAAGLQTWGYVGVAGSLGRGTTNAPVMLSFTRVVATSVRGAGIAPSAPSTTTPRTTAAPAGAGSVPLGATAYAIPAGAVYLAPKGSDKNSGTLGRPVATLARALALAPTGGTVVVRAGTYHQGGVTINKRVTVQAYPHEIVWFDGARAVGGWTASGSAWSAPWSSVFDHSPTYTRGARDGTGAWQFVNSAHPYAAYPDMTWINGAELVQVGSKAAVSRGKFFVDTSGHRLYIGNSPVGARVTASDIQQFARINAAGTRLLGIGMRNYADSVPQMGALTIYGSGTLLENDFLANSATQGVAIGKTRVVLRHITVTGSGLLGIQAVYADGLVIDGVRVEKNNDERFNMIPTAGGIKIGRSRGMSVKNSLIDHNYAQGIWTDESCYNIWISGNTISSNSGNGIDTELSQKVVVVDNVVNDNGQYGYKLFDTGDVAVWNNTFRRNNRDIQVMQDSRKQTNLSTPGHDPRQKLPDMTVPWRSNVITIRNNIFDNAKGNAVVAIEDYTFTSTAEQMHVTTDYNMYARAKATAPTWLVLWSAGSGNSHNPYVFKTLAAFRTAKHQEAHSATAVTMASMPAIAGAPLPSSIAGVAGRAAGLTRVGAWH